MSLNPRRFLIACLGSLRLVISSPTCKRHHPRESLARLREERPVERRLGKGRQSGNSADAMIWGVHGNMAGPVRRPQHTLMVPRQLGGMRVSQELCILFVNRQMSPIYISRKMVMLPRLASYTTQVFLAPSKFCPCAKTSGVIKTTCVVVIAG